MKLPVKWWLIRLYFVKQSCGLLITITPKVKIIMQSLENTINEFSVNDQPLIQFTRKFLNLFSIFIYPWISVF